MPRTPGDVVIGLDVGTSATKAVAFAPGGRHRTASRAAPLRPSDDGRQEQDPDQVATAVVGALADCVAGLDPAAVVGVSISTAMHGLLGLDVRHRALTPILTWGDGRAVAQSRRLRADHPGLHAATGTPVHPMAPLAKLAWFAEEAPALASRVHWWVDLKAWVLLRLTGTLATDTSSASGWGMLDLDTRDWHPGALAASGTTRDHLPTLVDPGAVLALGDDAAIATGLPPRTPVVAGAADGPLANLGVGATEPGVLGMSVGTSAAVRAASPAVPDPLDPALFCYGLVPGTWIVGGALSTGGLATSWSAAALAPDLAPGAPGATDESGGAGGAGGAGVDGSALGSSAHLDATLALAATAPPGSAGLVMVPALLPPRSPTWDPTGEGAWLGLGRRHGRAHLVRSAIEGVALDLADLVDRLDALHPVREVRVTGGAFRSTLWRQVVAGALGRPLTMVGDVAGTALGAAALGWWALDHAASPAVARRDLADDDPVVVDPDPELVAAARAGRTRRRDLLAHLAPRTDPTR